MSKRTTLVTGAGGFVGQCLCRQLAEQGARIIAQILPGESLPPCETCVEVDLREPDRLADLADCDIETIYHLAAHASVPASVEDPRMDLEVNVLGTFNLLELARRFELKAFVFASTVSVLDDTNPMPLSETAQYGPNAPYPAAKMAGEGYCAAYWKSFDVPTKVVRFFNIYGPGIRRLVVHDLIRKLLRDPSRLEIFGDGGQVRDFLHVEDAAAGLRCVAERGQPGQTYHIGSGQAVTIRELIDAIIAALNLADVEIVSAGESWKGDMREWYADTAKVRALGFGPKVDLVAGLAETAEWIRRNEPEACE